MKFCSTLLFFILSIGLVLSQELPKGTWSLATDLNGNTINAKKVFNTAYQQTIFSFINEKSYSFSYEEYDATGKRITEVKEIGSYTYTQNQIVLTPQQSSTSFYSYLPNTQRPSSSTIKQNPLQPAVYAWEMQQIKSTQQTVFVIEALNPSYREGIFSSRAVKNKTPLSERIRRRLSDASRNL